MKNSRKILIAIGTLVILLAACASSSDESSDVLDNHSEDSSSPNDSTDTDNNNESGDTTNNVPAKEEPTTVASLKDEYLKKLNDTKKETEELEATDSSTYAMKKVANDRWEIWDQLLNEVYGVLKEELTTEEMDQLRKEQLKWIKYRDDAAKEASLKYEGGTQEQLEYVTVLANLTEERCYELVEDYMK
jgi:uncharacterized protein YecT (DUF1311 family)